MNALALLLDLQVGIDWADLVSIRDEIIGQPVAFAIAHIVKPGQSVVGSSWKQRWSNANDLPDVREESLASFFETLARTHHLTMGKEGHVCEYFLPLLTLSPRLQYPDVTTLMTISFPFMHYWQRWKPRDRECYFMELTLRPEPRIDIEFLTTKSSSRHKGYATALVDWVAELADELGCPCYLDGGGRGMGILERVGFVAHDLGSRCSDAPPCVPMVRRK